MRTMTLAAAIGVVAAILAPAIVLADDSSGDHPSHIVKDSAITAKIKTKLAAEHLHTLTRVHVDTDANGVVWLSGTVHSQEMADRAVAIARDIDGVNDVHSHIRVVPPG